MGANLWPAWPKARQYGQAADASLHAAELGRGADGVTAARTIAATARCLLFLQREVERAESLLVEAQGMGIESTELALGWGYLHSHQGRRAEATPYLERALVLAARDQDHWREWAALARRRDGPGGCGAGAGLAPL
jgi:hypothetical protein